MVLATCRSSKRSYRRRTASPIVEKQAENYEKSGISQSIITQKSGRVYCRYQHIRSLPFDISTLEKSIDNCSIFFLSCRRSRRILYCFSFFFFFLLLLLLLSYPAGAAAGSYIASVSSSSSSFFFFLLLLLSVNIAISPTAYMVWPCDSGIFISLMTATKLMGLEIHLRSFGVTGVKKVNHVKNMRTALI